MMTTSDVPVLLLLGAGAPDQVHNLQQIAAAGHRMVLVDRAVPVWARPHLAGTVHANITDERAVGEAVRRFASQHRVSGVLTFLDHHVGLAAELARSLGLPANDAVDIRGCQDRALTRIVLAKHFIPSARYYIPFSEDAAVDFARILGYPVIVKPRATGIRTGIRRADNEAEVRAAYGAARAVNAQDGDNGVVGVLVEEYLEGPSISVEAVVTDSKVRIAAVVRTDFSPEPTFEVVGQLVEHQVCLDHTDDVTDIATNALAALNVTHGVVHIEFRLTPKGPRVSDICARLGGDFIPQLVQLALGTNLAAAAAAIATGSNDVRATASQHEAAAVRFAYPSYAGRVEELALTSPEEPWFVPAKPWLKAFAWTQEVGSWVSCPPSSAAADRLAYWVVTGESAAECEARLSQMTDSAVIRIAAAHGPPHS